MANNLIGIFCTFGAPKMLHTDNGKEFNNSVIKEVASSWEKCKLVRGRQRHSQSQGSVEAANKEVQKNWHALCVSETP